MDHGNSTGTTQARTPWVQGASNETLLPDDDVMVISEALMAPEFRDLDKILSFDEMIMGGVSEASGEWSFGQPQNA